MSFLSSLFGKSEEPINLNDAANHNLVHGLVAHFQAEEAEARGSVAAPHLREIAIRYATISSRIDDMLEANEKAGQS